VRIIYPAGPDHFTAQQIGNALVAVGLPALAGRLDEEAHWGAVLSLGEQQRLMVARAILHEPDYLFLDEATASLDEAAESALYRLLHERLPQATIVSIGHRSALRAFHRRHIEIASPGTSMLKAAS
jgi:putative ATP-binding cassette transporter